MHKPDLTGCMTKWILDLSEYQVEFKPQYAIQAQVLANFLVENTLLSAMEHGDSAHELDSRKAWVMYVDGSARQEHKKLIFDLQNSDRMEFSYALKYTFSVSNNESEYEALLARLQMDAAMNIEQFIIQDGSKIVFVHVTRSFEAKEENMKGYSTIVQSLKPPSLKRSIGGTTKRQMICQRPF